MASPPHDAPDTPDTPTWQPEAIIFDLLTALLDSWTLWTHSTPSHDPILGRAWRERYLDLTYTQGPYIDYGILVQRSASAVGLPASAAGALLTNMKHLEAWPEGPAVLAHLKARELKLGVVTNCSDHLGLAAVADLCAAVTAQTGFPFTFDAIVTAERAGFYKPHPKPYEDVLRALDVSAGEALFVAGSSGDIPGASGVGMRVVWHNRVRLGRKGDVLPWKEGATLEEALEGVLGDA